MLVSMCQSIRRAEHAPLWIGEPEFAGLNETLFVHDALCRSMVHALIAPEGLFEVSDQTVQISVKHGP